MRGPGWDNDAWQRIRDYSRFWTPFADRFHFRPGISPGTWPAIKEPPGSVTFDLSAVSERAGAFAADEDAFNEQVLSAMTTAFPAGIPLVALDWQHPAYWFWPHRQAVEGEPWRISPFPTAIITCSSPRISNGEPSAIRGNRPSASSART